MGDWVIEPDAGRPDVKDGHSLKVRITCSARRAAGIWHAIDPRFNFMVATSRSKQFGGVVAWPF